MSQEGRTRSRSLGAGGSGKDGLTDVCGCCTCVRMSSILSRVLSTRSVTSALLDCLSVCLCSRSVTSALLDCLFVCLCTRSLLLLDLVD
jgi:hypothetical protein